MDKTKRRVADPPQIYNGFNIKNRLVDEETMAARMMNRKIYKLDDITPHMKGSDIPGDWVVMGVLAKKLNLDTTTKTMIIKLFDMNECIINLLVCKSAFDALKNEKMGSFVAILNPIIMMPNQKNKSIGLMLENPNTYMKVGTSSDFGVCTAPTNDTGGCGAFINITKMEFCQFHLVNILQKGKRKRQEFASSTAPMSIIDKQSKNKLSNPQRISSALQKTDASYTLADGRGVFTGKKLEVFKAAKRDAVDDTALVLKLISENNMGSKMLRLARGMPTFEDERRGTNNEFSSEALRRLGYNPLTGRDVTAPQDLSVKSEKKEVKKKGVYFKEIPDDQIKLSEFEEKMIARIREKNRVKLEVEVKSIVEMIVDGAISSSSITITDYEESSKENNQIQ